MTPLLEGHGCSGGGGPEMEGFPVAIKRAGSRGDVGVQRAARDGKPGGNGARGAWEEDCAPVATQGAAPLLPQWARTLEDQTGSGLATCLARAGAQGAMRWNQAARPLPGLALGSWVRIAPCPPSPAFLG